MIDKNKTYRTEDGKEVRIYATDAGGTYPVHGAIFTGGTWLSSTWTEAGIYWISDKDSPANLVECNPLSELKVDDRILVRDNDNDEWLHEHFARISENGKILTFFYGQSSWSSDSDELIEWNQWRLPE